MSAWLISSSVRSRTLIVVAALGLLILGAIEVRNKPLEVIPELALPSLTAKAAERLGILIDDVRTDASSRRIVTYTSVLDVLTGTTWVCISADPLTFVCVKIDALKAVTCT